MARWRRIDAPRDDGEGLLDERAGLEGDIGERSDVSRAQRFTRGDGAGQHHRGLSTLGIFVLMGVGGFSARVLRGSVVVCHRGFVWPLDHRSARRAPNRGDVGPGEGQEGEEGEEAWLEARCLGRADRDKCRRSLSCRPVLVVLMLLESHLRFVSFHAAPLTQVRDKLGSRQWAR